MLNFFIEGTILGLTAGISCAFFCLPVFAGLSSRDINNIHAVTNVLYLILGRFFSYIFTGIFFSIVGMEIKQIVKFDFIAKILIGLLLVIWGISGFTESDKEKKSCPAKKYQKAIPFITGLLTGLSPCPPFIAGIARVVIIANIYDGMLYFTGFFLTTSIFLIPGFFTGLIKYKKELKIIASFVSIIFGLFFLITGLITILMKLPAAS
jgi:sulfite exporter TauE/SafE